MKEKPDKIHGARREERQPGSSKKKRPPLKGETTVPVEQICTNSIRKERHGLRREKK